MSDQELPIPSPPDWLLERGRSQGSESGMLDDDTGIIKVPYFRLLQKTSEQEGKKGHLWSDAHNRQLVTPVRFVPLVFQKVWSEFEEGGGSLLWQSSDPNDERVVALGSEQWRYLSLQVLAVAVSEGEERNTLDDVPGIIVFRGKNMAAGRSLYNQLRATGFPPRCCEVSFIGSKQVDTPRGSTYVGTWRFSGYVDKDRLEVYDGLFATHGTHFHALPDGESDRREEPLDETAPF